MLETISEKYKIAAVVVTYNRLELLQQCIDALLSQKYQCDILIVDNASTDGTKEYVEYIASNYDNIKYSNTGTNIGGAGGFNFGFKWAAREQYDYIWVMDDDCIPKVNTLEKLVETDVVLKGNYGWIASVVLWKDGHECIMNRPKLKKSFYDYLELLEYGLVQAENTTFVSLFLNMKVVRMVGLPIKEFFIWGDDIEYTRRISKRYNLPCFIVGTSQVIHAMRENSGSNLATDVPERIDRYIYAVRNGGYYWRQEGWKGTIYYFALCSRDFFRILFYAPNKKFKRITVLIRGMFRGFIFNPDIEYIK